MNFNVVLNQHAFSKILIEESNLCLKVHIFKVHIFTAPKTIFFTSYILFPVYPVSNSFSLVRTEMGSDTGTQGSVTLEVLRCFNNFITTFFPPFFILFF